MLGTGGGGGRAPGSRRAWPRHHHRLRAATDRGDLRGASQSGAAVHRGEAGWRAAHHHHGRREHPRFPEGIMGPSSWCCSASRRSGSGPSSSRTMPRGSTLPPPVHGGGGDNRYLGRTVIISTGASARGLRGSPGACAPRPRPRCATCDGFFFKGQKVCRGGGDTAMEEANFLTKFASKVVVVHRRVAAGVQDHAGTRLQEPEDRVHLEQRGRGGPGRRGKRVTARAAEGRVRSGALSDHECGGLFVAIGHSPNTELFHGKIELDLRRACAVTKPGSTTTSIAGVSPAATFRTTCSGRRSPPRGAAAWRRSRRSAGSRPRGRRRDEAGRAPLLRGPDPP